MIKSRQKVTIISFIISFIWIGVGTLDHFIFEYDLLVWSLNLEGTFSDPIYFLVNVSGSGGAFLSWAFNNSSVPEWILITLGQLFVFLLLWGGLILLFRSILLLSKRLSVAKQR